MNKLGDIIVTLLAVLSAMGTVVLTILARMNINMQVNWYGIGAFACSAVFIITLAYCRPDLDGDDDDE